MGNPKGTAPFPYENPALFSMAIAFAGICRSRSSTLAQRAAIDRAGFVRSSCAARPASARGRFGPLSRRRPRRIRGRPASAGAFFLSGAASGLGPALPVRISTSRPPSITAMSLASRSTSLTRWLTKTIGIAKGSRSVSINSRMSRRRASSIAVSGSSISSTLGLLSSARPIATRCFSPPERRRARASAAARRRAARRRHRSRQARRRAARSAGHSQIVRDAEVREEPRLLEDIADAPRARGLVDGARGIEEDASSIATRPSRGRLSPATTSSSVVLPAPEGPHSARTGPFARMSASIGSRPARGGRRFRSSARPGWRPAPRAPRRRGARRTR